MEIKTSNAGLLEKKDITEVHGFKHCSLYKICTLKGPDSCGENYLCRLNQIRGNKM